MLVARPRGYSSGTVRIATWNVEYAAVREKNRRRLRRILEMDCDIWVLTETNDELHLGDAYRAVSTTPRPNGREGSRWVTLWSRLPIVTQIPVEDACRTVAAFVASPQGHVLLYGTVLPWHSDRGPAGDARAWAEHHRVIPLQTVEWARLRRDYPDAALCVAGDFNMNLRGPHYYGTAQGRRMLKAGLEEAGLACLTETD